MTFQQFYSWYEKQHGTIGCRLFHLAGAVIGFTWTCYMLAFGHAALIPLGIPMAYLTAWAGHIVEGNRPASFQHPFYSAAAYFVMLKDIVTKG
jgi:hypothetical protein